MFGKKKKNVTNSLECYYCTLYHFTSLYQLNRLSSYHRHLSHEDPGNTWCTWLLPSMSLPTAKLFWLVLHRLSMEPYRLLLGLSVFFHFDAFASTEVTCKLKAKFNLNGYKDVEKKKVIIGGMFPVHMSVASSAGNTSRLPVSSACEGWVEFLCVFMTVHSILINCAMGLMIFILFFLPRLNSFIIIARTEMLKLIQAFHLSPRNNRAASRGRWAISQLANMLLKIVNMPSVGSAAVVRNYVKSTQVEGFRIAALQKWYELFLKSHLVSRHSIILCFKAIV